MKGKTCDHGLSDACVVTSTTVVEDRMEGTRMTIRGFWCPEHRCFGHVKHRELIPVTVDLDALLAGK